MTYYFSKNIGAGTKSMMAFANKNTGTGTPYACTLTYIFTAVYEDCC
jgi:hypothetical protein